MLLVRLASSWASDKERKCLVGHILDVRDGTAFASHSSNFSRFTTNVAKEVKLPARPVLPPRYEVGKVVVDMKDVNVTYGTRKVK